MGIIVFSGLGDIIQINYDLFGGMMPVAVISARSVTSLALNTEECCKT